MARSESSYPKDWLRIAEKDLGRVELMLEAEDPDAAGFYLQQTTEKFLKAFLLSNGWQLKRIHDLETLLNDALQFDPSLEEFRDICQRVTGFYFLDRYPMMTSFGVTDEDVKDAFSEAAKLIARLRSQLDVASD